MCTVYFLDHFSKTHGVRLTETETLPCADMKQTVTTAQTGQPRPP